jgi:hypothetical protein
MYTVNNGWFTKTLVVAGVTFCADGFILLLEYPIEVDWKDKAKKQSLVIFCLKIFYIPGLFALL